jgi:hypothetical protein
MLSHTMITTNSFRILTEAEQAYRGDRFRLNNLRLLSALRYALRHEVVPDFSEALDDPTVAEYHEAQRAMYRTWLKGMEEVGDESPSSDPVLVEPEYDEEGCPSSWILRLRTRHFEFILRAGVEAPDIFITNHLVRNLEDLAKAVKRLYAYLLADDYENQSSGQKYRWRSYAAVIRTLGPILFPRATTTNAPDLCDIMGTLVHFDAQGS